MPIFVLTHRHRPEDCTVAFAAWRGFESPLRRQATLSTCAQSSGWLENVDHTVWWTVEAADEAAALALLPPYVAERTKALEASEVPTP